MNLLDRLRCVAALIVFLISLPFQLLVFLVSKAVDFVDYWRMRQKWWDE